MLSRADIILGFCERTSWRQTTPTPRAGRQGRALAIFSQMTPQCSNRFRSIRSARGTWGALFTEVVRPFLPPL